MTIALQNVSKCVRGINHIKNTNLIFEPGQFNILLGERGVGKTSLIKLMAGLDDCSTGQILMHGKDVTALSPQKRNISLVHQFFVNYPHMTVYDNIASPLKISGLAASEIDARVEAAADILQLRAFLYRYPHQLSGGQQQRTALARAIAKESQAIFLDEPLANLDYKLREELRDQLPDLFTGRGTIVVYATSEPEEALLLGGSTALMHDGHVTQFGKTSDIYRRPNNIISAEIFSDPPMNKADIVKKGSQVKLNNSISWKLIGEASKLADGKYIVGIRPHHVAPNQTKDAKVKIAGKIVVTELSGSQSSAHFNFDSHNWVSLAQGVHPYGVGDNHNFYIDISQCFYFTVDGKLVA